jgi:hypothetical protein
MAYADQVTHTLKIPVVVHLASDDEVGAGVTSLSIGGDAGTRRGGCRLRLRTAECYCVPQATTSCSQLTCIDIGELPNREVARTSSIGRAARINSPSKTTESFRDLLQHSYYRHGDNVMDLNPWYTSVVLKR